MAARAKKQDTTLKITRTGKTYEEIFGEERAEIIRNRIREKMLGENNPRFGKKGTFSGRTHTEETVQKLRIPFDIRYGEEKATEMKLLLSSLNKGENNPMYGKVGAMNGRTHTSDARLKMSNAQKGRKRPPRKILTCPYCKKASDAPNAKRWLFDNCKNKKD